MKAQGKFRFRKHSFTLIEVVVVIIILVTLASIATPIYLKYVKNANVGAARTQIKLLGDCLMGFRLDMGTYPDSSTGLRALVENADSSEKWKGPYINPPLVPKDPWGNEYIYVFPGEHGEFDLTSYGADGQPGGEGENADINSWE